MYDQLRTERVRLIAEAAARVQEVGRQGDAERISYEDQVRLREIEIQRLHIGLQAAEKNAYESQQIEREAAEELARAQVQSVIVARRVATPAPADGGSRR